jgi:hypothetical protein
MNLKEKFFDIFKMYVEKKSSGKKISKTLKKLLPYQIDLSLVRLGEKNDGGYLVLTHPSGWRNVNGKFKSIQNIIKSKRLLYLNMNSTKSGKELFGVNTDYDYYVLHNKNNDGVLSKVVDYSNNITNIDLSNNEFIPNSNLELTYSLVAKDGEDVVNVLYSSSAYETRNSNTSPIKTAEFKYPCAYTVGSNNPNFWYSNNKGVHFDVPKVIWGNGLTDVMIDKDGEYGLTQFAYAIVDDVENLDKLAEIKKLKVIISPKNFFNKDQFRIKKIQIQNANFSVKDNNLNYL